MGLALVVALHVLRPDVDPIRDDVSLYAVGPFGTLMAAAFIALPGPSCWPRAACSPGVRSGMPSPPRAIACARST